MNTAQKILTLALLALFTLTLLLFPWDDPHNRADMIYPVFLNYGGSPDWHRVRMEWLWLAVMYVGLFFVLRRSKASS